MVITPLQSHLVAYLNLVIWRGQQWFDGKDRLKYKSCYFQLLTREALVHSFNIFYFIFRRNQFHPPVIFFSDRVFLKVLANARSKVSQFHLQNLLYVISEFKRILSMPKISRKKHSRSPDSMIKAQVKTVTSASEHEESKKTEMRQLWA